MRGFTLSVIVTLLCVVAPTTGPAATPTVLPAAAPLKDSGALTMGAPIGASWGATYGLPPAPATPFGDAARAMGASFTRVTLYWSQLEPKEGLERWTELDAYLQQLASPDEGFVTLASASPWATRAAAWVFPSSPAKDPRSYERFVRSVVRHIGRRVRYFQNDPEPNNPFFWSGSVDDFIAQQKLFYRAVKEEDPDAVVILGGCDGLFDPSGKEPLPRQTENLAFFAKVIAEATGHFDVFDLRLYADPYTIPARATAIRELLDRAGGHQPIIATEYAGPLFLQFRANRRYAAALNGPASSAAVRDLEARDDLPIETRMFLVGAGPEDRARLLRLQTADLVVRNTLALSSGIQKTAFWDLWHDTRDPSSANTMMFGTFRLLEQPTDGPPEPTPLGLAFGRMAARFRGVTRVRRVPVGEDPDIFAFSLDRPTRPSLWVVWRRPPGPADERPPTTLLLPWDDGPARASNLVDEPVPVRASAGAIRLDVGSEPVFIEAAK